MNNRRSFLKNTAVAGIGTAFLTTDIPGRSRSALEAVNIACVGCGGKGASDMAETAVNKNIVAICDVDGKRLDAASKKFVKSKKYTDWRKLLDQKDIDAVTVSTPDHMHASVSQAAIDLKKHVYTQKPLTNTVSESRLLTQAAEKNGVITQMGTQHHSAARIKNAVEVVQSGVIGKVGEVHAWTDRPGNFWKQGLRRPVQSDAVPKELDWNLWLGVAPKRPFVQGLYHPFHWRGWWDFGTGALGDMGCHLLDPVFSALNLGPPTTVSAKGPEPDPDSGPLWCEITYTFSATDYAKSNCKLFWYEAGRQPKREIMLAPKDWAGSKNGVLFVGEKGNVFVGFPEPAEIFPRADFANFKMPQNRDDNHYQQWTEAIKGNGKTSCPFSFAGPMTEAVLLGNVAYRSGEFLQWDPRRLETGSGKADKFVARKYRKDW
ncbi:MAG: Gfo/Idh/MocA family oxidoreductase [Planctomycetota bacterium]|nr:Gfo/Idh/MocA family oxidoreductase [Planctomycetota bacterium]